MRWYWSTRSVPELSDLPAAERRRLGRDCWPSVARHWQVWVVFGAGGLGLIGGMYLSGVLALLAGWGWPLAISLVGGAWGALFGAVLDQVSIPLARPYLRAEREKRGLGPPPSTGHDS